MDLLEAVGAYAVVRGLRPGSVGAYCAAARAYSAWAGGPVDVESLAAGLGPFIAQVWQSGRSPAYCRFLAVHLRAVARWAGAAVPSQRLPRVSSPMVEAWSVDEVSRIVVACQSLGRWGTYMRRLVSAAYYTGLAEQDLFALPAAAIGADGVVRCRRLKTGAFVVVWLPNGLAAELRAVGGRPLAPECSREYVRRLFRRAVAQAGVPAGPFKRLRVTSGTVAEAVAPGFGHRHLGDSRAVFCRYYWAQGVGPVRLPVVGA